MAACSENKVITFLKSIKTSNDVIDKFIEEKIDENSVNLLTDNHLKELGLRLGDRILVMNHFQDVGRESRQEKVDKLKALIDGRRKKSMSMSTEYSSKGKKTAKVKETLRFEFGWKHWSGGHYVQKKKHQGGGCREYQLPRYSTKQDCLKIATALFFPEGVSAAGHEDTMELTLGNYNGKEVDESIYNTNQGTTMQFTAENYKNITGLTRPRLYLLSRPKDRYKPIPETDCDVGSDDDDAFYVSVFETVPANNGTATCTSITLEEKEVEEKKEQESKRKIGERRVLPETGIDVHVGHLSTCGTHTFSSPDHFAPSTSAQPAKLIGTSVERQELKQQQDEYYQASLKADKEKEWKRKQEKADMKRKEKIKDARKTRVPPEPSDGEPSVHISVQHITIGVIKRKFKDSEKMSAVYDWVGSMNDSPEYFTLVGCSLPVLDPSMPITVANKVLLNMRESDTAPGYPEEEEVNFLGYGPTSDCNDTVIDSFTTIPETPPALLMEGDISSDDSASVTDVEMTKRKKTQKAAQTCKRKGHQDKGYYFRQYFLPYILNGQPEDSEIELNGDSQSNNNAVIRNTSEPPSSSNSTAESIEQPALCSAFSTSITQALEVSSDNGANAMPPVLSTSGHTVPVTSMTSNDVQLNALLSPQRTEILTIRRVNVMKDMIDAFKNPQLLECFIEVIMINGRGERELGQDTGGIFRDALSAFWTEIYEECTLGEQEKVPALRHDFQMEEWKAIGHILVKGFIQAKYFPAQLCKAFLIEVLFGQDKVEDDLLIQSFKFYLSNDERAIVGIALEGKMDEDHKDEWLDFLETWHCKTTPTEGNKVKVLIQEMAHKELIQAPKYVSDSWKEACAWLKKLPQFDSVSSALSTYQALMPTTKQVIEMLEANPCNNAERDTLAYIQRYIRGLGSDSLAKFLRFCTGGDVMCTPRLTVSFNTLDGAARRIIAHTCGLILDVPTTYASFPEFRKEMNCILNSGVWEMDYV